jgi:ribosome-binding factor A
MALDKRTREAMRAYCDEIHADDGIDPKEFFKRQRKRGKANHHGDQLCRQVAETMDLVLSGDTHDELLQSLHVVSVVPAPDSSRLLVALHSDLPPELFEQSEIESRLAEHAGRLRCAIASAITRRKTPNLTFQVSPSVPMPSKEDTQ